MWVPYVFWPAAAATVISAALIAYILRAGLKKPGNTPVFIMFLSLFIWSLGELLERLAGPPPADENLATTGVKILMIGLALAPATFIHLAIDYPRRLSIQSIFRKIILYTVYGVAAIYILLAFINEYIGNIVFNGVYSYSVLGQQIWGLKEAPLHMIYDLWMLIAAIVLFGVMIWKYKQEKIDIIRSQMKLMIIGLFIGFLLVLFTGFIPPVLLGISMYPLTTVAFTIVGLFVIYTIYRYRMFLVAPTQESATESEKLPEYGIIKLKRDDAYEKFVLLARSGYPCLAFIGTDIEKFKDKYGLKTTPVFQITKESGKDRLNPKIPEHMEMISFIIISFVDEANNPVVLLDINDALTEIGGEELKNKVIESIMNSIDPSKAVYIFVS